METAVQSATLPENLSPAVTHKLRKLEPGTYCSHRSWGFGQVKEWNNDAGAMIIDFKGKKGHSMQFQYAAESLDPISPDHIQARKLRELDAVKKQAKEAPVDLIRNVVVSLAAGATVEAIHAMLSPEVVSAADWKKWWDSAKRELKKDGHFYLPTRKTEPVRLLEEPSAMGNQALETHRTAIGPKALLAALIQVAKHWEEVKSEEAADEILANIAQTIVKIPRTQLATAIELAIARDEFLREIGRPPQDGPASVAALTPTSMSALASVIEDLPSLKQSKLLEIIARNAPNDWSTTFVALLPRANARTAETIADTFEGAQRTDELFVAVNRLLRERNVTCDFLYGFLKQRREVFRPLFEPQLILAILSVLEKDQFSEIKKGTRLYELVLSDKELMSIIIKNAPLEDVRDITRAVILTPVFEELDKRSLLATIIKLHPEVQSMVVGDRSSNAQTDADLPPLYVSRESHNRYSAELSNIVTKRIPENSKEIGIARDYGDLRENHEFKAAKEQQGYLMSRKAELEGLLARAVITDFSKSDPSVVGVGSVVTVEDATTKEKSVYTILGAWDSDPTKNIMSYMTARAAALIGRRKGDKVRVPDENGPGGEVLIVDIKPYK